jgi:hypothetical protein
LHKARLVAQGFAQQEGRDYHETFAPTLKYVTLRWLLVHAAKHGRLLRQLDVTTAYLNARMEEEVYMRQPDGFVDAQRPHAVCRLRKSLYGTKQAGHNWNKELNGFLTGELALNRSRSDPCLYWRATRTGGVLLLCVFVDDMVASVSAEDEAEWLSVKARLMRKYPSKDLGAARLVLGMTVHRHEQRGAIVLEQRAYIEKVLQQWGMDGCKPARTPEEARAPPLSTRQCVPEAERALTVNVQRRRDYESLVGSLLYAAVSTRPDIAHAVNQLTRFMAAPGDAHWQAAKRVLRYLAGTRQLGLTFHPCSEEEAAPVLCAYTDADWAGDTDTRRSTTGYAVMMHGCCVAWLSKKQPTVALSSAEAEYMAIGMGVREIKWMRGLITEVLHSHSAGGGAEEPCMHGQQLAGPRHACATRHASAGSTRVLASVVRSDNQAALSMCAHAGAMHQRTKHIDVRHHFIQEAVEAGEVRLEWCPSAEQLADLLTKGLGPQIFSPLRDRLMDPTGLQTQTQADNHTHE